MLMLVGTIGRGVGIIAFFRPVRFARITDKRSAAIIVGTSVVIGIAGAGLSPDTTEDEVAQEGLSTTTAATTTGPGTTTSVPAASPTTTTMLSATTTSSPIPLYEVVAVEDVSFQAVRLSLWVTVEVGTSRDGVGKVAAALVEAYRSSEEYLALIIFFYHHAELVDDVATLGVWEDVPYGDWGRAADVARDDYSQHEAIDKMKEKDWSLLPSPDEVGLYVAYNETLIVMTDSSDSVPSDDDVIAVVASKESATLLEVEEALDAVLDWMFGDMN